MRKAVEARVCARRQRAIDKRNQATHQREPNFHIGDLVLVRRQEKSNHKLRVKWYGPRRIMASVGPLFFCCVQQLNADAHERVDFIFLVRYCAALDGKEVAEDILQLSDRTESQYEILSSIFDIAENHEGLWFRIVCDSFAR